MSISTKSFARTLRKSKNLFEYRLWSHLRNRKFKGYEFRRQYPIAPYIVDFCCLEKKLIIELDGGQHGDQKIYDEERDRFLVKKGFRVLRFWNSELNRDFEGVLGKIGWELDKN